MSQKSVTFSASPISIADNEFKIKSLYNRASLFRRTRSKSIPKFLEMPYRNNLAQYQLSTYTEKMLLDEEYQQIVQFMQDKKTVCG